MAVIHETDVQEKVVPGRFLRWVVEKQEGENSLNSKFLSCCVMRVEPGSTVRPAHSHPDGEEMLYIVKGEGKVYIDGVITPIKEGSIVLFEQGAQHMVRNSGSEEMKVVCFFAPAASLDEYVFHPEIEFEGGTEI